MGLFFVVKRLVGMVVQPLPVVFFLLLAALLLRRFTRRKKSAVWCVVVASAVLFAASFPSLVRWQAGFLERRNLPHLPGSSSPMSPSTIVVLGNGVAHPGDGTMPAITRLNDAARARLVEGVRLSRVYPDAALITTGYGMGLENCGDATALAAVELGVAEERVRRLPQALDTGYEAELVREAAGGGTILLVTTAVHMPRALLLFRDHGLDVVPAPCDFIGPVTDAVRSDVNLYRWRSRGGSLADSEEIWHEIMGLIYYHLFISEKGSDA